MSIRIHYLRSIYDIRWLHSSSPTTSPSPQPRSVYVLEVLAELTVYIRFRCWSISLMYVNMDGLRRLWEGAPEFESAQHFQAVRCVIRLSDIELSMDYGRAPVARGQ